MGNLLLGKFKWGHSFLSLNRYRGILSDIYGDKSTLGCHDFLFFLPYLESNSLAHYLGKFRPF